MRLPALAVCVCLATPAEAALLDDYRGVRSDAMGGAHRGLGTSNDTLFLNPAGMSLATRYSIELGYGYAEQEKLYRLGASVVDSKSGPVAAGIGYTYLWGKDHLLDPEIHRFTLGLSYALGPMVAVGISGRHVRGDYFLLGETETIELTSGDAGIAIKLPQGFSVGFSVLNIVETDLPELTPLTYAGGVSYDATPLTVAADVAVDASDSDDPKTSYHVGAEYFLAGQYPVRIGYQMVPSVDENGDPTDDHRLSGGAGWISQGGSIGATYSQSLNNSDNWVVSAAIGLFL